MRLTTMYYQNFSDPQQPLGAQSYGGWKQGEIELSLANTAIVVMHAWDLSVCEGHPGWLRAAEWLERARSILEEDFPNFLQNVRSKKIPIFHVASDERYCRENQEYKKLRSRCPCNLSDAVVSGSSDAERIRAYIKQNAYCGSENQEDVENAFEHDLRFAPQAAPMPGEPVAASSEQLQELCRLYNVDHLIYTGFCINWCLLSSPGGIIDMHRSGKVCSVIRQLVTAVENKETAAEEKNKELALWRISLEYGLVLDMDNFISAIGISYPEF